jgi:hypothetical protein
MFGDGEKPYKSERNVILDRLKNIGKPMKHMLYPADIYAFDSAQLYPTDWPAIAYAVKSANNWRCAVCNKLCRRPGEMWLGWEYELTCAHISQEYDGEAVQVAPLCLPCHFAYDAPHSGHARRRRNYLRQTLAGQLPLIALQR